MVKLSFQGGTPISDNEAPLGTSTAWDSRVLFGTPCWRKSSSIFRDQQYVGTSWGMQNASHLQNRAGHVVLYNII